MKKYKLFFKLLFHLLIIALTFVGAYFVFIKGYKLNFLEEEEPEPEEVVVKEVETKSLYKQLVLDLKNKVINEDEYVRYLLYSEYDKKLLDDRYKDLETYEVSLDSDDIVLQYSSLLSNETLDYYLSKVLLKGVTFDVNSNDDNNLNKVFLSENRNFLVWYSTSGKNAISAEQAMEIGHQLEQARIKYDSMYTKKYDFDATFGNEGTVREKQLSVLSNCHYDKKYLDEAMSVFVTSYTEGASAKYVGLDRHLRDLYSLRASSDEGSISGPYLIIKPTDYIKNKERSIQIINRELYRYYQYNVYCPGDDCIISSDKYMFNAIANYASSVATNKTNNNGYLNEEASIARRYSSDLLSKKLEDEYDSNYQSFAFYVYLYNYVKNVPDGDRKLIDALYADDSLKYLNDRAGSEFLAKVQESIALHNLRQDYDNYNLLVSTKEESDIQVVESITDNFVVESEKIDIAGIDYYTVEVPIKKSIDITLNRSNDMITCMIVGVSEEGTYDLLTVSSVNNVGVNFNTGNYDKYNKYYIIVTNNSLINSNFYSIKIRYN